MSENGNGMARNGWLMGLAEVTGIDEVPIWWRIVLYFVDNVLIAILVGVAVYLVQRQIEVRQERTARRVASDQFVAETIRPLMQAINENTPLLQQLASKATPLTGEDVNAFDECHQRQSQEIEKLRAAREFNAAAFEPYRVELDAVERAMDELSGVIDHARANGIDPHPGDYLARQGDLREAGKALSNKSSVAVYSN